MAECRYFPECQRCNEIGDLWIPCTGGADGIQCGDYEPMPDVGALLELADEMQRELDECASDHEIAGNLENKIHRIREALKVGVEVE